MKHLKITSWDTSRTEDHHLSWAPFWVSMPPWNHVNPKHWKRVGTSKSIKSIHKNHPFTIFTHWKKWWEMKILEAMIFGMAQNHQILPETGIQSNKKIIQTNRNQTNVIFFSIDFWNQKSWKIHVLNKCLFKNHPEITLLQLSRSQWHCSPAPPGRTTNTSPRRRRQQNVPPT